MITPMWQSHAKPTNVFLSEVSGLPLMISPHKNGTRKKPVGICWVYILPRNVSTMAMASEKAWTTIGKRVIRLKTSNSQWIGWWENFNRKPDQFDGKIPWVSWKFSPTNQSNEKTRNGLAGRPDLGVVLHASHLWTPPGHIVVAPLGNLPRGILAVVNDPFIPLNIIYPLVN